MVALANAIPADAIPPMVRLSVVRDLPAVPGVDYLGGNLGEALFTTPGAVARLWRSYDYRREMTLSVESTVDPNGRPLNFDWVLLRGDPGKVRISRGDAGGHLATISVDWHETRPVAPRSPLSTDRIDIGVFANNGVHDSAPAFISIAFPVHQKRVWEEGPTGMRLRSLGYAVPEGVYADPVLWPRAAWRDTLLYDADGRRSGLVREVKGGGVEQYVIGRTALRDALVSPSPFAGGAAETGPLLLHMVETDEAGGLVLRPPAALTLR